MSTRIRIAFWRYLFGTLIVTAFGIVYLVRPDFMPYHPVAVGPEWATWAIAVSGLVMCAGSFYAMMLVAQQTPAPPSRPQLKVCASPRSLRLHAR